jgi:hypothetical protein
MLAFMNREALQKTLRTGMMHYWSRSRGRLWMKGEESKHFQHVLGAYADCDRRFPALQGKAGGECLPYREGQLLLQPLSDYRTGAEVIRELEEVVDGGCVRPRRGRTRPG